MSHEIQTRQLDAQFPLLSDQTIRDGEAIVFDIDHSSYRPQRDNHWNEVIQERNLRVPYILDGGVFKGRLYVSRLRVLDKDAVVYLARMELTHLSTRPELIGTVDGQGRPAPQLDLSLVPEEALSPNLQTVVDISYADTPDVHIHTIDMKEARWFHYVRKISKQK